MFLATKTTSPREVQYPLEGKVSGVCLGWCWSCSILAHCWLIGGELEWDWCGWGKAFGLCFS